MYDKIQSARRLMLLLKMGRFALRGAFYSACLAAVCALTLKFHPVEFDPYLSSSWSTLGSSLGAIALVSVLSALTAFFAIPTLAAAAVETDQRSGLAERLSTAMALAARAETDPVVRAVERDAVAHAAQIRVGQLFRFEWPWEGRYLSLPLIALVAALALPEFDLWERREEIEQHKELLALMSKQAAKLKDIKDKIAEGAGDDKEWDDLEAQFDQAAQELTKPKMTKPKAMAKLSKLAQALEERRQKLAGKGKNKLPRDLERKLELTKKVAEAMNKGDLEAAAEELQKLAEKLADGDLSDELKQKLTNELKALMDALQKKNPELAKALAEAAEKLSDNDLAQAAKSLRDAGLNLKELQQMLDQIQKMDMALAQLAKLKKDLGDKKGPHSVCRGCGTQLQCESPLCDKLAGGECPMGDKCPHAKGFCSACTAMGMQYAQLYGMEGMGQGGKGKGKGGKGGGMGGPGRGRGGEVGELPDPNVDFEPSKIKGMQDKAKPLGLFFTRGAGKKGKSKVKAVEVVREFRQAAEDALTKERIPAGYKNYIRQYFNTIEPEKKRAE